MVPPYISRRSAPKASDPFSPKANPFIQRLHPTLDAPFNSGPMKFFIDTADLDEIREAHDLGVLDGVTTNPSLMAKSGITGEQNIKDHYVKICEIVNGDVSAEVIATDFEGMVAEGKALAALHPNIVVKVPMIKDGVKALKYFSDNGIRTNCTLVFSAGQAILAAKAGATMVSPFMGRVDDITWDGVELVEQIVDIYTMNDFKTEVLAASIRNSLHIVKCAEVGADIVTCPLNSIMGLLKHPLTDVGLEKFLADYKKGNA
jgi:transaldolase